MEMDKRALIAVILALMVLIGSQYLFTKPQLPAPSKPPQEEKKTEEPAKEERSLAPSTVLPISAQTQVTPSKEITVETDLYTAVFSTRGATVRKWDLKKYANKEKRPISLLLSSAEMYPLSIIPEGQSAESAINVNYASDKDSLVLKGEEQGSLSFIYSGPSGASISKTFTFYNGKYDVDVVTEVSGVQQYQVTIGSAMATDEEGGTGLRVGPVLLNDNYRLEINANNIEGLGWIHRLLRRFTGEEGKKEIFYHANNPWIAEENRYFTLALAPTVTTSDVHVWKMERSDKKGADVGLAYELKGGKAEFLLYAGPKKYEILKAFNRDLEHIIDFGFFSILARPLFWILKSFDRFTGNYGWSIILLTVIVRIPFIPLLSKSQRSMRKMQELQPKLTELREKYKKDPQRLQKETLEMYKKYKVNPVGGCLPMLLQIPVFFALYKVLMMAFELRGAPFMLWITDLSAKDPYYILPIVMGITMVIQQKMTPTSLDPKQNKMMMMMPIIFTFMFLNFASGLVLYWLVNNVLSIVQQFFTNRRLAHESA